MKINYVSIDPSINSTALIVNDKIYNYCKSNLIINKKNQYKKWYKMAEELVVYRIIDINKNKTYSENEIIKLNEYDNITNMICKDIINNIDLNIPTIVAIEGYNFGSRAGHLIDLVTFTTLLRIKIYKNITKNIIIISPSTLKLEACKITYKPIIIKNEKSKKTKYIYMNNNGVKGGSFKKNDIFLSIVDNNEFDDKWKKHCNIIKDDFIDMINIPKPYEDINDCYMLYKILQKYTKIKNNGIVFELT